MKEKCWRDVFGGSAPHVLQIFFVQTRDLKVRPKTSPNAPLFLSRIGKEQAITVSYLNNLVKRWGKVVGVKENLGSHSLRKSFGYHQRLAGTSLPILVVAFNHSTQYQTLAYLGIEEEELTEAFLNVI